MPSGALPRAAKSTALASMDWRGQVAAWSALLARCRHKPTRKRVHSLRSATLRLQTELEFWQDRASPTAATANIVKRWIKQAARLRHALRRVREADVSLARLACLREMAGKTEAHLTHSGLRQIDTFERRLERRRKVAAAKLVTTLDVRHKHLERLSEEIGVVPISLVSFNKEATMEEVFARIADATEKFPSLNADNLHAFRCQMRKAHYLAAQAPSADAKAQRVATALQCMQTAAGEWHDWQSLLQKAARVFPKRVEPGSLVAVLEEQSSAALRSVLGVCVRTMPALLHSRVFEASASTPLPKRFPPARVVPESLQRQAG